MEQYEYDAAMQLKTLKDGQGSTLKSYTYDANGNMTSDGTKTYTWDCMNRLTSIAQSGQPTVYYTYRPDGLRATKQIGAGAVTRYVYDGQNLIAEKDSSGDVKVSYTIGKGEVISRTDWSGETPATVFFLYDGNCNVDAVVDEDGVLVKQFTYDVFGAVREVLVGSGAETVGFVGGIGHITDLENSLVYMRARYYDPSLGRFISQDPGCNGTNWYIYCDNNPVNMIDVTGTVSLGGLAAALTLFMGFAYTWLKGDTPDPGRAAWLVPAMYVAYLMANPASPLCRAMKDLGKLIDSATGLPGGSGQVVVFGAAYALFLNFVMDWLFEEGPFQPPSSG